jgi:hypothetical protein
MPTKYQSTKAYAAVSAAHGPGRSSSLVLSAVEKRNAAIALLICIVARFLALLPGYSIDDYGLFARNDASLTLKVIAQGRALFPPILRALTALGSDPPFSGVLGAAALSAVLIGVGLVVCRSWGIENRSGASLLALLLISLHPYQAEIFTFRTATVCVAIAMALAFAGFSLCARASRAWPAGVAAIIASLFLYQSVLNYLAIALLFTILFRWTDETPQFSHDTKYQVLGIGSAVLTYLVLNRLVIMFFQVTPVSRSQLLPISDGVARIGQAWLQVETMFWRSEPIMPAAVKLLLLAVAVLWLILFPLSVTRVPPRVSWVRTEFLFVAFGVTAVPFVLGLALPLREWWPVPRIFAHIGVFWAAISSFIWIRCSPRMKCLVGPLSATIIFSFVGINNHVFLDQNRLNMRDLAKANRIIERLEQLPEFPHLLGVIVDGGSGSYSSPIQTIQGDMNVSGLYASWSKTPLLNELSGQNWQTAPDDIQLKAGQYCNVSAKWPAPESVAVIESFGVICLAK